MASGDSGTRGALERFRRDRRLPVTGEPTRETMAALGLNPDSYLSGSSSPRRESDRLNRREVERVKRSGQILSRHCFTGGASFDSRPDGRSSG